MFTKTLILGIAAFSMVSFSDPRQTNQEDTYGCPFNSSEVTATCTSGCYSFSSGGVSFPLTPSMQEEAGRRLQNWCNTRSILQTSFQPPAFL